MKRLDFDLGGYFYCAESFGFASAKNSFLLRKTSVGCDAIRNRNELSNWLAEGTAFRPPPSTPRGNLGALNCRYIRLISPLCKPAG